MTSDFWVGRYVQLHLMISDVGRWVGQIGSEVRSAICEFLLFPFVSRVLKGRVPKGKVPLLIRYSRVLNSCEVQIRA